MEKKLLKYGLILLFFSLFVNLGTLTLHHEEPRRGIITFEMLKTHNFLQPTVLGEPYYKKPPLHNWTTALTSYVAGHVSESTLRFPSVISVILTALLIYFVISKLIDKKTALFSSFVYTTFFVVLFGYSTKCEPDTLFTLLVSSSILFWYLLIQKGKELSGWTTGYLFTALALLTKGLPALHFFLISVAAYLIVYKDYKKIFSFKHLLGALLGLLPFCGWLLSVNTELSLKTLLSEVISRSPENHPLTFTIVRYLTFPFRFLLSTFPWSFVLLYLVFKERETLKLPNDKMLKFFILTFILNGLIYWIFPGSRLRYVMPILPFFAVLIAYLLKEKSILHKRAKKSFQFFLELSVPILIVLGVIISHNSSLILKETIAFLAFSYFFYFYVLPKINYTSLIVFTFFFMLLLRAIYSCYFIPIAELKYPPYREKGRIVAELTEKYPLYTKTKYLQFCFYVENFRNKILKFSPYPPKESLFLSEKKEGNVLYRVKVGRKKFYVCSYSLKSLKISGNTLEAEPLKVKSQ